MRDRLTVEQNLLGAMLLNNTAFFDACKFTDGYVFSEDLHKFIYDAIASLVRDQKAATPMAVRGLLFKEGSADGDFVPRYLARMLSDATPIDAVPTLIDSLQQGFISDNIYRFGDRVSINAVILDCHSRGRDDVLVAFENAPGVWLKTSDLNPA